MILLPVAAHAFHAGSQFDKPAGAGGGGGVFYTGAPRERRWDCTACHTAAPKTIKLGFTSAPAALLDRGVYTPGQAYVLSAKLIGEHAGLGSPESNYNSLAIAAVDADGEVAGKFSGYAPEDFYDGGTALVSAGKKVGVASWSFTWTAPAASRGRLSFYVCVVDGDGANSPPGVTLTDPFGDDVACGSVSLEEASVASREPFSAARGTEMIAPMLTRLALVLFASAAACSGTTGDVLIGPDLGPSGDLAGPGPTVAIDHPADGTTIVTGNHVAFAGHATDPTDGTLTGAALVWASDLDGPLGTGEMLSVPINTRGTHKITLTATDSLMRIATAQISLVAP